MMADIASMIGKWKLPTAEERSDYDNAIATAHAEKYQAAAPAPST